MLTSQSKLPRVPVNADCSPVYDPHHSDNTILGSISGCVSRILTFPPETFLQCVSTEYATHVMKKHC